MPPVIAAIGAFLVAVGVEAVLAYAIATVIVNLAVSAIVTTLLAPKQESVTARQARTLRVQLGEVPRGALLGRQATAGSLLNIWNDGNDNQFETAVFALADHECDAIEGVIVNDKEYVLSSQGAQSHADFQADGESKLSIQWALGAPNQTTVTHITTEGVNAGQWTSNEASNGFKGFAYVVARYKVSDKVWKSGRPSFVWIVRGAKLYDPRKDSSVQGGAGAHRWGDSSTYEWTDNARVCHYNFVRGIYSFPISATVGQLMVGPGRTQEEAPAADAIADIALCDEPISLAAGGTEPRYRVSAAIEANEKWIDVEENLAAAMAGQLVERAGTIAVDVGAWKPLGPEIVDDSFISGTEMQYQEFKARDELTNTVHARFVDPKQLYRQASILPRFKQADIDADGEVRDATLDLVFVSSQTQAQRCAEIARRRARLQRNGVFTVGPRYMLLEAGDWIRWRSQRRFAGEARTFELQGVANTEDMHVRLVLTEIDGSVFDWDASVDELDYLAAEHVQPTLPANPRVFGNLNVNGGVSGTFSAHPLTGVGDTTISVAGATWTGAGGETDVVPSGSIGSLANSTQYWLAYDREANTFVSEQSFAIATTRFSDAGGRYLMIGTATTHNGGGVGGSVGEGALAGEIPPGTLSQVTFGAAGAGDDGDSGGSLPIAVPYPSGIVDGSFLTMHVAGTGNSASQPFGVPSEWTLIDSQYTNLPGHRRSAVYWRIADGSETGSVNIGNEGGSGQVIGRMYRHSHGSGIESAAGALDMSADTTADAVNVTSTIALSMAVQCIALFDDNATLGEITGESGANYTEAVAEFAGTTAQMTLGYQVATLASATSVTGGSAASGVSTDDAVHGFVINP